MAHSRRWAARGESTPAKRPRQRGARPLDLKEACELGLFWGQSKTNRCKLETPRHLREKGVSDPSPSTRSARGVSSEVQGKETAEESQAAFAAPAPQAAVAGAQTPALPGPEHPLRLLREDPGRPLWRPGRLPTAAAASGPG